MASTSRAAKVGHGPPTGPLVGPPTGPQGGPPTGPAAAIIEQLRAFTTTMDRYVDVRGGAHGLHRTDLHALAHVMDAARSGEQLTPGGLAHALHLSSPATSALLARLESVGHVRRTHAESDRRRVSVTMTEEAMHVGRAIFGPLGVAIGTVVAAFGPGEQETVLRFLTAVVQATSDAVDQPEVASPAPAS